MATPQAATEGLKTSKGDVLPKCDDTAAPGHWFCTTHNEEFPNNMMMHSHTANGKHVVAWVCHVHGPEVP